MKFFSTALAAFAVGSAVAAPILDALSPCTSCKDESGVGAGTPDVPSPCTAPGGLDIGAPDLGQVGSGGHVGRGGSGAGHGQVDLPTGGAV
jgi:hypothetical protein